MSTGLAHLAVAVTDLDEASRIYRTLGFQIGEPEIVSGEKVRLRKATCGELCIELLEAFPAGEGSIAKSIAKRGSGLHHVALTTDNLSMELQRMAGSGIMALPGYPARGSNGTMIAFLDPRTTGGVLIELVEEQ